MYVDDLMIGGENVEIIVEKKVIIIEKKFIIIKVFKDVLFIVYKWYLKVLDLVVISSLFYEKEIIYVK